jgi:hypothetical protein
MLQVLSETYYHSIEHEQGEQHYGGHYAIETNTGYIMEYALKNNFNKLFVEGNKAFLCCVDCNIEIVANSKGNMFIKVSVEAFDGGTELAFFRVVVKTETHKAKNIDALKNLTSSCQEISEKPYKYHKGEAFIIKKGKRGGDYLDTEGKKVYI